ncbi:MULTISPECIES: hypothetical protein [Candidatus Nitrosocaldus]|jgi:hypothetical protein|uniref:Uncharacterized protein n=1 Tax=Candidatus Nitrosocaldus cavascurensis TaxID=2058097 RepID=A0A2K5AST3_9ARCH|nr:MULTISPECIES: hypothetical protein [Candidatus Nitrosocaldus]SPC34703.1 conserved protein of unknown function [Candidatus Nitrosocaldus cavascurensis]
MLGFGKKQVKEGDYVFATIDEGSYSKVVLGYVNFAEMDRIKVTGIYIKPIGLLDRARSGRITQRQQEVLRSPTPDNIIHIIIDRVEYGIFDDYLKPNSAIVRISAKRYSEIETWVRDGYPELFSILLSPIDPRREEARQIFMEKYNSIYDSEFKQTVSAVARQLRIL